MCLLRCPVSWIFESFQYTYVFLYHFNFSSMGIFYFIIGKLSTYFENFALKTLCIICGVPGYIRNLLGLFCKEYLCVDANN